MAYLLYMYALKITGIWNKSFSRYKIPKIPLKMEELATGSIIGTVISVSFPIKSVNGTSENVKTAGKFTKIKKCIKM